MTTVRISSSVVDSLREGTDVTVCVWTDPSRRKRRRQVPQLLRVGTNVVKGLPSNVDCSAVTVAFAAKLTYWTIHARSFSVDTHSQASCSNQQASDVAIPPLHSPSSNSDGQQQVSPKNVTSEFDHPVESPSQPPFDVESFLSQLERASAWNHGQPGKAYDLSLWDYEFCRETATKYESFLQSVAQNKGRLNEFSEHEQHRLLSSETVILALKVLLKCHYETDDLARKVRQWEKAIAKPRMTPLTDHLSLRLLTANAKAGNVGRVLALLQLRKARQYRPRRREFVYAINSLHVANHVQRRNIFVPDIEQPATDNPTRWLDAILLNMHQRGYPLTTSLANQMLLTYSAGSTAKAVHHFYRVIRRPVAALSPDERPNDTSNMPHDWFYLPMATLNDGVDTSDNDSTPRRKPYSYQPIKVQLKYHAGGPPYYKVPSQVRGKLLYDGSQHGKKGDRASSDGDDNKPRGQFKLERESDPTYSIPLAAAFSFCDSLQHHGACGHAPIQLNTASYNALIKACVQRGALWRAMELIDHVMPSQQDQQQQQQGASTATTTDPTSRCIPNVISYNLLLAGLAAVGDLQTAQEYYNKMLYEANLEPDAFTIRAIVEGLLNLGDVPAAITMVQDCFNQHGVLPPYTTHIKILEISLARNMIWEAKRYVYFIQQLWHWKPNKNHSTKFVRLMEATQRNTQLQKPALIKLFAYFGETLDESDFL